MARGRPRRDGGALLLRPLTRPPPAYQPRWSVIVARGPRRGAEWPECSCRSRTARARCPAQGVSSSAISSSSPSVRPVSACTIARARWKSPNDTASRSPHARTADLGSRPDPDPRQRAQGVPGLVCGAVGQSLQCVGTPCCGGDGAGPSRIDACPVPGPAGDPRPAGTIRCHHEPGDGRTPAHLARSPRSGPGRTRGRLSEPPDQLGPRPAGLEACHALLQDRRDQRLEDPFRS